MPKLCVLCVVVGGEGGGYVRTYGCIYVCMYVHVVV